MKENGTSGQSELLADWRSILRELQAELEEDSFWSSYLRERFTTGEGCCAAHLGIFVEPYLDFVLEGKKTVESRFSANRCDPWKAVHDGDLLLLKASGGPITGVCQVGTTWFYELDPESWSEIRESYAEALCAHDPSFWTSRNNASFATLMQLHHIRSVTPKNIRKRDRRGWVVLQRPMELPYPLETKDDE